MRNESKDNKIKTKPKHPELLLE